jgi:rhodanese-related sulfurtransferase
LIRKLIQRGLKFARDVSGPNRGVGFGVGEYSDFERLRREAAAQDQREGVHADDGSALEPIMGGTREIGAEELRILLEVELPEDRPQIIDVRDDREWASGHLPGAVHIPLSQVEARLAEIGRDRAVVTYCATGIRSIDASYALKKAGYTDVRALAGGIEAWKRAGGEVK